MPDLLRQQPATHVCDCDDCSPEPVDRCKYEEAIAALEPILDMEFDRNGGHQAQVLNAALNAARKALGR